MLYTHYTWDNNINDWIYFSKKEYSYDTNNNQTLEISYTWNSSINDWVGFHKLKWTYDVNNNVILLVYYYWNNNINDWEVETKCYNIRHYTNINEFEIVESNFNLYPNPSTGQITIESDKTIEQVEILDINGKIVKQIATSQASRNDVQTIDLSKQAKGVYFVKLIGEGFVSTQKLILE